MKEFFEGLTHLSETSPVGLLFVIVLFGVMAILAGAWVATQFIKRESDSDKMAKEKDAAFIGLAKDLAGQGTEANRAMNRQVDVLTELSLSVKTNTTDVGVITQKITKIGVDLAEMNGRLNNLQNASMQRDRVLNDMPGQITRNLAVEAQKISDKLIKIVTEHIDVRFDSLKREIQDCTNPANFAKLIDQAKREIISEIAAIHIEEKIAAAKSEIMSKVNEDIANGLNLASVADIPVKPPEAERKEEGNAGLLET